MLPPAELAFSGIDLDAVLVPRIEEISEQGTFTRPMPEQAAVLGQRGRQVLPPHCCDAVGGAVPPGHMPPPTLIRWHIPRADHPELPAADQSRRPAGTCIISADIARVPVPVITLELGREAALAVVCVARAGMAACGPAWLRAPRVETEPGRPSGSNLEQAETMREDALVDETLAVSDLERLRKDFSANPIYRLAQNA